MNAIGILGIIGVIVSFVLYAVASVILFFALMCLRCKVSYSLNEQILLTLSRYRCEPFVTFVTDQEFS